VTADLTLKRFAYTPMGTFGTITFGDGLQLYTVERPWLGNKPNVSCIPVGKYICKPRKYFRGGYDAFEVVGIPNRSHILFHVGNTMQDVQGCIALCSNLGTVKGIWGGVQSRAAFKLFMERMGNDEFQLTIENSNEGLG